TSTTRPSSSASSPRAARSRSPRCYWSAASGYGPERRSADQQLEQRLLRVQAVLRLVPHRGALAVEDAGGDLLAGVRQKAVERNRLRAGAREERLVEAIWLERGPEGGGARLVAHAHPDVRVES